MTKSKNTKRALLMSALSMMLCIAMLAGTTFAWFTDSVTSGMNKIVAGNLNVELEYASEFNDDGSVKTWTPVTATTELFSAFEKDGETTNLWEPGHTEYVCLRIRNAGTLALKYAFNINVFGDENGGGEKEYTNVDGEKFKLSSYLVFNQAVYEKEEDLKEVSGRDALWLATDEEKANIGNLYDLGLNGELLKTNEAKVMMLVVYMPTWVGNEANQLTAAREGKGDWEGKAEGAPAIYLGLDLAATQTPYESDSFDDKYDVSADGSGRFPEEVLINKEGDTIISHKNVSITVPFEATATDAETLVLTVKRTGKPTGIVVGTNEAAQAYDISLKGLKTDNTKPITVELSVEKGLKGVKLYHNDKPVDGASYDEGTGIITFTTTSFSPFTVVYNKPLEAPARGTDTNGISYNPPVENEDGTLTFTPTPKDSEDTPNITFTADPNSKELTLTSGMDYSGDVTLPAAITGTDGTVYPLTAIADNAIGNPFTYNANQNITSVTIPDTVKSIGEFAFAGCTSLKSVTIPNSVTTISEGAFSEAALEEVTLPESITEISSAVFCACDKLTTVNIPNSVTKIGDLAFADCTALTSIEIPDSVTFIDSEAFSGSGLESVEIPASVTTIAGDAFSGCESLTHLIIPDTVKEMTALSFYNCSALEYIVLPTCAAPIPSKGYEYSNCNKLEAVYYRAQELKLPTKFSKGGNSAFVNAKKYVYSETRPTDTEKPVATGGGGTWPAYQVEYWYWHMVDDVPTPWEYPGA